MSDFSATIVTAQQLGRLSGALNGEFGFLSAQGAVTTNANLTLNVAAIAAVSYVINSAIQTTAYSASTVTHDAAHASLDRIDTIKINTSGAVGIEKGTAAADPVPPDLASTELEVAQVLLGGGVSEITSGNITQRQQRIAPAVEGPMVPRGVGAHTTAAVAVGTNTVMGVCLVEVPFRIRVTDIAIAATAAGTSGTVGLAIFSNDGQTRLLNETTGTISGSGEVKITLGTPLVLEPGFYYFVINPDGTASVTIALWSGNISDLTDANFASTAGNNEIAGSVTVTAGVIPTSFDPDGDVTVATAAGPAIRLN